MTSPPPPMVEWPGPRAVNSFTVIPGTALPAVGHTLDLGIAIWPDGSTLAVRVEGQHVPGHSVTVVVLLPDDVPRDATAWRLRPAKTGRRPRPLLLQRDSRRRLPVRDVDFERFA